MRIDSLIPEHPIAYQLTREEAIAQFWRLMLRPRLIVLMALSFLGGVGVLTITSPWEPGAWGVIGYPLVALVFFRRAAHNLVAQHPEYLEPQTVSFDEAGITFANSVARVHWPWTRIRGVTDSP